MFRFEGLEIWQSAQAFVRDIYIITQSWPKNELFGLVSQVRRSVVSIAANIAEGSVASTVKDYKHFLDHARKSLFETVSHLLLAEDLGYLKKKDKERLYTQADILSRKIVSFKRSLR